MVRVKGDENVVFLGETVNRFGENNGSKGCIIDIQSRSELSAAGRNLNNSI